MFYRNETKRKMYGRIEGTQHNRKFRKNKLKQTKNAQGGGAHGGCFQDLEVC